MRTSRDAIEPFTTKDGSIIRELLHPGAAGHASLAEATLPPGRATLLHRHARTEETYHFVAGEGEMRLGAERFAVRAGDTVRIPPGTPHALLAGRAPLVLLCVCAPPYSHEDTEILEEAAGSSFTP